MSDIGAVIQALQLISTRAEEAGDLVHQAQHRLDDIRSRMQRVLADSHADDVARAHGVSAAAVGHLAGAAQAIMQASDIARHRAGTL